MADYHVCTKGLRDKLLFRDDNDFVDGMNRVPLVLQNLNLKMLAFCLMSNHVHFVMTGGYDEVYKFISEYKRRTALALRLRYKEVKPLRNLEFSIKEITSREYLKTVIAYVIRNPLGAGIHSAPYGYKWSSGHCYFVNMEEAHLKNTSSLSYSKYRKSLKTRVRFPESNEKFRIDTYGAIEPACYIDVAIVERLYGRPTQFLFFLSRNTDSSVEAELCGDTFTMQDDTTIAKHVVDVCLRDFNTSNISSLSFKNKLSLAETIRREFGATNKQLSRILQLKIDALDQI